MILFADFPLFDLNSSGGLILAVAMGIVWIVREYQKGQAAAADRADRKEAEKVAALDRSNAAKERVIVKDKLNATVKAQVETAREVAKSADEVKTTLADATNKSESQITKLTDLAKTTHALVNGALLLEIKGRADALTELAELKRTPEAYALAEAAHKRYEDKKNFEADAIK